MAKKGGGIMHRLGRAVGSVAAGYESERDAAVRKDAQRIVLAVMSEHPDASEKEIARIARARIADEHGDDDPRLALATSATVTRLQRALAVAALERNREAKDEE